MKVVVCGAGEVGSHAAEKLAAAGNSVIVIDTDAERLRVVAENMDVGILPGNCAHASKLQEAGISDADLIVAATDSDEVNLLAAAIGKKLGARKSIARVHHSAYFDEVEFDYPEHLGIDLLICPEFSTAVAIARALRNPAALAIEHFARGRIEMQEFPVSEASNAVGRPLAEVRIPPGTRLAAVTREDDVLIPAATTELQAGDRVVLVGNTESFFEARDLLEQRARGRRSIVLMGGQPISVWLCRALRDRNWSIRLFETNRERAEELAQKLEWVTVLQADPTDAVVFREEQLSQADAFIALLDDDEANIISCVLAKSQGVMEVMAVVQRPNYLDLLYHIGLDRPFSPRAVAAREIENILDESPLRRISSVAEGQLDVYRVHVGRHGECAGKPLAEARLAPDWVVCAIRREEHVWVPEATDFIQAGDTVLVVGHPDREKELRRLFMGK